MRDTEAKQSISHHCNTPRRHRSQKYSSNSVPTGKLSPAFPERSLTLTLAQTGVKIQQSRIYTRKKWSHKSRTVRNISKPLKEQSFAYVSLPFAQIFVKQHMKPNPINTFSQFTIQAQVFTQLDHIQTPQILYKFTIPGTRNYKNPK